MTWFQVFMNPIVQSTFQADAVRVNEDFLVAIASCFHVQNNAGECRRKSTFLYKISTNTTTSIKCCRSVTRDYPSCTIMSALLPLQRIAEVFFCIIMSAQILLRDSAYALYWRPGWQKLRGSTGGTRRKVWTQTKILSPNIRYFVAN